MSVYQKQSHYCKKGPGRKRKQGNGSEEHKTIHQLSAGAYGQGLLNWRTNKPAKGRI